MTLTRRRVSPKVRSMTLGVADPVVALGEEALAGGQALAVGEQALDRGGMPCLVAGGEVVAEHPEDQSPDSSGLSPAAEDAGSRSRLKDHDPQVLIITPSNSRGKEVTNARAARGIVTR